MEADKHEGVFYEHLAFESKFYDCESTYSDIGYCEKLYNILTMGGPSIKITEDLINKYKITEKNDWRGMNAIYDAWFIINNRPLDIFPFF